MGSKGHLNLYPRNLSKRYPRDISIFNLYQYLINNWMGQLAAVISVDRTEIRILRRSRLLNIRFRLVSSRLILEARVKLNENKTAFTRCRHVLKTVKISSDRPPVHTKTAHFLPADFENGRF